MVASKPPGDRGVGAGLSLASPTTRPGDVQVHNSQPSLASRAVALSSYFLSGALCINLSQFLGTPLYLINQDWYNAWIAFTKQSFGLLTMTLTQTFSPTRVIVSGDASVRGQLLRKTDGTLLLDFPERIVLIANHQIYTDWLYLWWTAYCSGMHGRLYIILKESLKKIPVLGWGMQFSQFIFLKRNWEKDRAHLSKALQRLNKAADPMWLLLFPEGTNLAPSTRDTSAKWAAKNNIQDMRHCLLPRSTGLRFCLQELRGTVDYLYDCTIAYEGVPRGAYAQDIFTLKAGYLEGRPPKSVSMYWRRFAIKNIPLNNEKVFELWLLARWREKDLLIENYHIHGRFPGDTGVSKSSSGEMKHGVGHLNVEIKSSHWYEFLQIFAPMGILAMVLYIFYGALPKKFFKSETGKAVLESTEDMKALKSATPQASMPQSFSFDMLFDKEKQNQTFGSAGTALVKFAQTPEAQRMMDRADLVQKWLHDPQKVLVESLLGNSEVPKQNFLASLKEEETRRKALINKHQGSFWSDLENAEAMKVSTSGNPSQGTFYKQLATAEALKKPSAPLTQKNLSKKANFWDDLNKESSRRGGAGTVMTLPSLSSASSSTAINSMNSGSTVIGSKVSSTKPAKLGPKKDSATRKPLPTAIQTITKSTSAASISSPPKLPSVNNVSMSQRPKKLNPAQGASMIKNVTPAKSTVIKPAPKKPPKLNATSPGQKPRPISTKS